MAQSRSNSSTIDALSAARGRVASVLTIAMMIIYFGFILLVAYNKPLLGRQIVPGLSIGVLIGALVIVASWALIWIYVRWANRHYDSAVASARKERA